MLPLPEPVVDEPVAGTSVNTVIEFGVIRISTGRPSLFLALTMNELGASLMSVNPADVSLCRSSCGSCWAACMF